MGEVTITVTVGASVTDTFTNTVTIATDSPESNYDNNTADEATDVSPEADLTIQKLDDPDPVVPGEQLQYTLVYTNFGPSDATDVVVADNLPPEVVFVQSQPTPSSGPNPATWNLGTLAAGDSGTIEVTVQVQLSTAEGFTNTVTISTETPETNYENNSDDESTGVTLLADLAIEKNDTPDPVVPGELLTYTLTYTNNGPSEAVDVLITDQLPPGLSFIDADPNPISSPDPLVWDLGTLVPGDSGSITITVQVALSVTQTFTNTATITSSTPDPDPSNNRDDEPTDVALLTDVAIQKVHNINPVQAGADLLYTLTYVNNGPSDATNVTVTDLLPAGVSFVQAVPSQDTGPNPLVWNLGTLESGASGSIEVKVTVKVEATGTLTNSVTIATETPESNYENNEDEELTGIRWPPVAVTLLYFRATPREDHVLVEWETANEVDNVGFNLYRGSTDAPGDARFIHQESARGNPFEGAYYYFQDPEIERGEVHYYWLEDVDIWGVVTQHGPVRVVIPFQFYLPLVSKH
jgi:uncharacterized repeat protein (TIGR01451 family)